MSETGSSRDARHVFISGVFDIQNYGDVLFPLIARRRLASHGIEVHTAAPAGGSAGWRDTGRCIALSELFAPGRRVDGLLIGGGNIVYGGVEARHLLPVPPPDAHHDVSGWGAPAIWLAPVLAAAIKDVPVAWNAPGVPHPLAGPWRTLIDGALGASDYVAVRDPASRSMLDFAATEIEVVPDPAAELARMWPKAGLIPEFRELLRRKAPVSGERFWVVHVRDRSLGATSVAEMAAEIDGAARAQQLVPILIAIGPSLGDAAMAAAIGRHLREPAIILDDPSGPREIAAAISQAEIYTGASLHGYVTAAAYDVPGLLVARPAHRKHSGFLAHISREQDLRRDWPAAFNSMPAARAERTGPRIPNEVFNRLDRHWDRVVLALSDPSRQSAARARFLGGYLRQGLQRSGTPAWLLGPFSPDRVRESERGSA